MSEPKSVSQSKSDLAHAIARLLGADACRADSGAREELRGQIISLMLEHGVPEDDLGDSVDCGAVLHYQARAEKDLGWLRKEIESGKPSFSAKQVRRALDRVDHLQARVTELESAVEAILAEAAEGSECEPETFVKTIGGIALRVLPDERAQDDAERKLREHQDADVSDYAYAFEPPTWRSAAPAQGAAEELPRSTTFDRLDTERAKAWEKIAALPDDPPVAQAEDHRLGAALKRVRTLVHYVEADIPQRYLKAIQSTIESAFSTDARGHDTPWERIGEKARKVWAESESARGPYGPCASCGRPLEYSVVACLSGKHCTGCVRCIPGSVEAREDCPVHGWLYGKSLKDLMRTVPPDATAGFAALAEAAGDRLDGVDATDPLGEREDPPVPEVVAETDQEYTDRAIAEAVATEREECAKICDTAHERIADSAGDYYLGRLQAYEYMAEEIRARGEVSEAGHRCRTEDE